MPEFGIDTVDTVKCMVNMSIRNVLFNYIDIKIVPSYREIVREQRMLLAWVQPIVHHHED